MFFGPIEKLRWPPWPLIGWDIFDFFSETAERNSTKLDRKQDLSVLYQVFVFRADKKNKMAVLASDWLRHFRLLLWNSWTEFNETWQEARSQLPLPSLCFRAGRKNKIAAMASDWLRLFSTSLLKRLNRIQRNLTGSKISTSSTEFVFFGPIGKTRWLPWPISSKKDAHCTHVHDMWPFGPLVPVMIHINETYLNFPFYWYQYWYICAIDKSVDDATFQLILRHLFVRGWKKKTIDHNFREAGRDLTQSYN